ncbi:hypothetical protein V1517DRAFT_330750 [Lipomyces orientalis]|uniref:Uncharacterized protein n=1 Tax=Lipomyces orientalis TaxID=1233043 RepID=A0ACC3TFW3_9ASCO
MSYRIETAKQGRAGCKGPACKSEGVKIGKGELRLGVFVTIGDNQSWQWRHWSCVTPQVIQNIKMKVESLPEGLDGYDEIGPEDQKRVAGALEEGHVADSEYKGDIETNRLGAKKQRKHKAKKESPDDANEQENGDTKTTETTEGRLLDEAEKPGKTSMPGRGRRTVVARPPEDGDIDQEKKRKKVDQPKEADIVLESSAKHGRGRPKKSDDAATESKTMPDKTESTESTEAAEAPAKRGRGRPKKEITAQPIQPNPEPPKRGRGRPKLTEEQRLKKEKAKEAGKRALAPPPPEGQKRGRGRPRKYAPDVTGEKSADGPGEKEKNSTPLLP